MSWSVASSVRSSKRRCDRDGDRRPQGLPGLPQRAPGTWARPCQPVLDSRDHSEHGRRLGLDAARDEGALELAVHRLRRLQHGDRRRPRCDQARPCRC